jgi:ribonucleotide monophosphatase NagD (HAD superfamily)
MIGDDIETDIGGAKQSGLHPVLVKTGKYRQGCERLAQTPPDAIIDSFSQLFEAIEF